MKIDNPTLRRQALGEGLRILRRQACLTLHGAARIINCSESKLSRVETGHRSASIEDIAILLGLYRADSTQRSYVFALAHDADEFDWLQPKDQAGAHCQHTLPDLESQAEQIVCFDPMVLPRLLQTHKHRNAALGASATPPTSDNGNDRRAVSARRRPSTLLVFMDEYVLHRALGGREILRRQLCCLRATAASSHSTIRVVPSDRTGAGGAFTLLRLPDRSPVVVLEHLTCRLLLERPSYIEAYENTLIYLDQNALGETESMELISTITDRLDS